MIDIHRLRAEPDVVTAALARRGCPPEEIMAQLSGVAAEHGEETGATCLYALYDPASRRCRFTSAGHPPPALRHPGGTVEFIDIPGGVMLGVVTDEGLVPDPERIVDAFEAEFEALLKAARKERPAKNHV